MGQGQLPLAHLARYREATYRLLSSIFLYPTPERCGALRTAAADLWEERERLARFPFFPELRVALQSLRRSAESDWDRLETEYVALFTANRGQVPCPPYESTYRTMPGESTGWLLAEVEQSYSAAGLSAAAEQHEMPDHVSVELEFMALLCGREATAWERQNVRVASHILRSEQRFLDSHIRNWIALFAQQVGKKDPTGWWKPAADAADAIARHDSDFTPAVQWHARGRGTPRRPRRIAGN